jgi:hypothetical protein
MEPMVNELFNKDAMDEVTAEGFGLFRIRLKGISTPMFIRFYRIPDSPAVFFAQSHFIQTPGMPEPHQTSAPYGIDELDAASSASIVLTINYTPAMRKSPPNDSWLVKNKNFQW